MADSLIIGYNSTAGDSYQITITRFADEELPRQTIGQTSVEFAVLGTAYATGPTVKQPVLWTVNAFIDNTTTNRALKNGANYNEAKLIKELYDAWDLDRANGLAARCSITDTTLMFGSTYSADAWFTEPPIYSVVGSYGSKLLNVVFGLTEI